MKIINVIPYKLRVILAEILNIPFAVGYLPSVPFATQNNEESLLIIGAFCSTVILVLGIMFLPILTVIIATVFWFIGRAMQGINQYNPPFAFKLLNVNYNS